MYFDNKFISTLPEFLKKIKVPSRTINPELLEKISKIANYMSQGKKYEYEINTAKQRHKKMSFFIKKENTRFQVNLPIFRESEEIEYTQIN